MSTSRSLLSLLALALTVAPAASAQNTATKPIRFGMTANAMSIDPTVAAVQMVGARSFGMQFDGGVTLGRFLYAGVDFGPQFLSDRASFTQNTTGGEMKSTAMLVYYSAMAGARTPSARIIPGLPATSLGVYGGASGTSGERSIDQCSNCNTETITVAGGSFVQPTLVFGEGAMRLRVSDRLFVGGKGIRSVISVGAEMGR